MLLYFYLHLSICLPMSRWNSLQLPSLPHVKGNEAAVPLVASRLKDLQDVQITKKQHGRMAIQCTHLEQSTLGKRKPLGSRRKSISWGRSCSFWSRPFHSDIERQIKRCSLCSHFRSQAMLRTGRPSIYTEHGGHFFIVVSLGHRMSTFIRLSQCPFLSKDSFFFECLVEHSNWPVPAMSNAWRLLPMSPPSDRRRRLTRAWTWNDSPRSWNLKHLLNRLCRWLDAWCMILLLYLASKLSLCNSDMLLCFVFLVGGSPGVGWTCKGCISKSHTFRGPRDRSRRGWMAELQLGSKMYRMYRSLQVKCWLASVIWLGTKQDFFRSCWAGRGGAGTGYEERDLT